LEMSEFEVLREYRQAKYPEKQITILAQLNGVRRGQIVEILRAGGERVEPRRSRGRISLNALRRSQAEKMIKEGCSDSEIARTLGVSRAAVTYLRRKNGVRRSGARRPDYDWARALILWKEGKSDSEIAREIGSCRQTVSAWRKRRHLALMRKGETA